MVRLPDPGRLITGCWFINTPHGESGDPRAQKAEEIHRLISYRIEQLDLSNLFLIATVLLSGEHIHNHGVVHGL